jgi:hypothetical protein
VETFSLGIFHMALLRLNRARVQKVIVPPWSPAFLFSAGQQGFWYDPSDLSTLFQDAAGSTPVTTVEQPVRLMRDKSGRGNHATASADARRPVLSARVNGVTQTEDISVGTNWSLPVAGDALAAGTVTGLVKLVPDATTTRHRLVSANIAGSPSTNAADVTVRAVVKPAGYTAVGIGPSNGAGNLSNAKFSLVGAGSFDAAQNFGTASYISDSASIVANADGTYTISARFVGTGASVVEIHALPSTAARITSYAGNGTDGVEVGFVDARVTNDGVGLPVYQRVTTSTDYDVAGFPYYLRFDGTDDCLLTGNIDFSATDKVTVCAGVRKFSDSPGNGTVAELSVASDSNAGSFFLRASGGGSTNWQWNVRATTNTSPAITIAAPDTSVLALNTNLGAPLTVTRRNGVGATSAAAPAGGGNFGAAYPLYIGARADSTLRFTGRLYALIGRGALSDTATLELTEAYVNGKARAY